MSGDDPIEAPLAQYFRETMQMVAPPGPDAVRATIHRRQRRRHVVVTSVVMVAVLSVLLVSALARPRTDPTHPTSAGPSATTGPSPTTTAPTTTAPNSPTPTTTTPGSAAGPGTSQTTPGPTRSNASNGYGTFVPAPTGVDLSISGPTSVTLTSDGTIYRGQVTITATNHGQPYNQTLVPVAFPAGVKIDFNAGNPWQGCSGAGTPSPYSWMCYAPTVPAGGSSSWVLHLTADYAPRTSELILHGLSFSIFAGNGQGVFYNEPNSADNTVTMDVVLPAT